MKRILFAVTMLAFTLPALRQAEGRTDVSIDFFYDNLSTGGNWVDVGDYGYCWQPTVAVSNASWRPYSDGYWAYTDVGWTWVSYEDFGWATYHYGRWTRLRDRGWFWIPGREWGPAWVSWRTGGDYVGWAPLPPFGGGEVVYEGRPITGQVDLEFDIGPSYYNFVDVRYIGEPVLRDRIFDSGQNINYINNTVNVTNITYNNSTVYNYGPDYNTLSAYSARPIQRLTLQRESTAEPGTAAQPGAFTKVQGDKLVVAAPQTLQKPLAPVAPKVVAEKIAQPTIEHGWSGVSDPKVQAALKQKMKTEDPKNVPPPDIKPRAGAQIPAAITTASPSIGVPAARPAIPASPAVSGSPATAASPATPASPAVPAAQGKGKNKRPEVAPAASVSPGAGINNSTNPAASATPPPVPDKGKGKNKLPAQPPAVSSSPGASLNAPASPAVPASPPDKGKGKNKRTENVPKPITPPAAPGVPDATAPPATSVPPAPPRGKGKERRAESSQPLMKPVPAPTVSPVKNEPVGVPDALRLGKQKGADRASEAPPAPVAPETAVGRPHREAPPEVAPQPRRMPPPERVVPAPPPAGNGPAKPEEGPAKPDKGKKKGEPTPVPGAPQ